jgi:zinc transporter 9
VGNQFAKMLAEGGGGSGVSHVVWLSLFMFLGSFLPGYLPVALAARASKSVIRWISLLGAGVLVGTALIVIIPEGVHELYSISMHQKDHDDQRSRSIGLALASGFAFMLLVERLSGSSAHAHGHGHSPKHSAHEEELEEKVVIIGDVENVRPRRESPGEPPKSSMATSIGLLVHAAVDGIALGSAASSGESQSEFIVFVALLLHKAPASFGLSATLLQSRLKPKAIYKQLLVFALTAPLAALVTFAVLNGAGFGTGSSPEATQSNLAFCLLFSGGTFLFVATMHILPEILSSGSTTLSWKEVLVTCFGIMCPLLFQIHHSHG